jgi:hypothetical protein
MKLNDSKYLLTISNTSIFDQKLKKLKNGFIIFRFKRLKSDPKKTIFELTVTTRLLETAMTSLKIAIAKEETPETETPVPTATLMAVMTN